MTAALVISAGRTDRKDRFSPEKQIGHISAIERIALLFQLTGIRQIVVVGDESGAPQKLVPSMDLIFLTAPPGAEMLDSIRQGLLYLQDKCSQVLVSYVDVPMFSKKTVQMLLEAEGEVCIPAYRRRCGHPVLLRQGCFQEIISYRGANGLKGAIEASGKQKQIVETQDAGILTDTRSGTPYETLVPDHDISKTRASFRLRISREREFYSADVHHLLCLTEGSGSLLTACQHMGISYTKGRKIIAVMEEQLGKPVLNTQQGGRSGGYSHLTEDAKKIMDSYSAFQEEAQGVLQELFQKYFSFLDP